MYVVPPSKVTKKDIEMVIQKALKNVREEGYKLVDVSFLWMPYFRVECIYQDEIGISEQGETSLNAMLYSDVLSSEDLMVLFRPKFLKYGFKMLREIRIEESLRKYREIEGSVADVDFRKVSGKLLTLIKNIKESLAELKPKLETEQDFGVARLFVGSRYAYERLTSKLHREGFEALEKEVAHYRSMEILIKLFLDLDVLPQTLQIRKKEEFYFPYLLIRVEKEEEGETQRKYLFVELVKQGKIFKKFYEDSIFTRLIENYKELQQIMENLT